MATAIENVGTATIQAGSAAVVGQGTRFKRLNPFDTFWGRNGERNIILSITDDTHLDLMFPASQAQAALPFAAVRTPDEVRTESMVTDVLQRISDSTFMALTGLAPAARVGFRLDANNIAETFPLTDFALTLLDDADAGAVKNTLGLNDAAGQTNAPFRSRPATQIPSVEWGHPSQAGFASTLGHERNSGHPFLMFFGGPGTNDNTYRTRGYAGIGIRGNAYNGGVDFIRAPATNADNQNATVIASLSAAGSFMQNGVDVVKSGTNSNGQFVRFADGTQICSNVMSVSPAGSSALGSIYVSSNVFNWTFPAAFNASFVTPVAIGDAYSSSTRMWVTGGYDPVSTITTSWGFSLLCGSPTMNSVYVRLIAIGRWTE